VRKIAASRGGKEGNNAFASDSEHYDRPYFSRDVDGDEGEGGGGLLVKVSGQFNNISLRIPLLSTTDIYSPLYHRHSTTTTKRW
jgi:hypothetical protein